MKSTQESATKIEIIWDREHGIQNAGYYARITSPDGTVEDRQLDAATATDARVEVEGWGTVVRCDEPR